MKNISKKIIGAAIAVVIIAVLIYGYVQTTKTPPLTLQGQLEANETNISSKISGRIAEIFVQEGDHLSIGSPVLRMDSPEVAAKVAQAKAVRDAASAVANKAESGARRQEIQMAQEQMQRAKANLVVNEKAWKRVRTLANEGLLSRQKADEVNAKYISAEKLYKIASAQYQMAQEGARKEDIAAAQAQARQGQGLVDEALVAEHETHLTSPVIGEVAEVIPNQGEIIAKGVPIVVVVDLQNQRLELNVREDILSNFALGKTFTGTIPALNNKSVAFKVYASAALPDFATWRPTRTDQGFDMRTFLVKSRPIEIIEGMRPGMSVLVALPDEKNRDANTQ